MAVTLEMRDNVAVVQIDDGKRNVINHDLLDELEELWTEAEESAARDPPQGARGLLLRGLRHQGDDRW